MFKHPLIRCTGQHTHSGVRAIIAGDERRLLKFGIAFSCYRLMRQGQPTFRPTPFFTTVTRAETRDYPLNDCAKRKCISRTILKSKSRFSLVFPWSLCLKLSVRRCFLIQVPIRQSWQMRYEHYSIFKSNPLLLCANGYSSFWYHR